MVYGIECWCPCFEKGQSTSENRPQELSIGLVIKTNHKTDEALQNCFE